MSKMNKSDAGSSIEAHTSDSLGGELLAAVMSDIQFSHMDRDENNRQSDQSGEEFVTDDEVITSDDDVSPGNVLAYQYDPKMSPERRREKDDERKRMQEELEKRSQPLEDWCKCDNCIVMERVLENVCCLEDIYVLAKLQESELQCVSSHDGFQPTVLNEHVLNMTRQRLLGMVKDPEKLLKLRSDSNETYRFLAYSNFRHWVCSGTKLGKGHRLVTPSCVVKLIREKWPSVDGTYTGYHTRFNAVEDI